MKEVKIHPHLEEAKRRFPVGTKFNPAHLSCSEEIICTVTKDDIFHVSADAIQLSMGNEKKNGHSYIELIYDYRHGWANIIGAPQPKEEVINNYQIY
jgi:hypothetical protein